jgi:hypothetical protein
MKIHLIFYISLLELYKESSIPYRFQVPPPPIIRLSLKEKKKLVVSEILDLRITRRKLEYLVQWQGYDISKRTWKHVANLSNAPEMIQDFHRRYLEKPSFKDA